MNHKLEIWVIILLITAIIIVHSAPVIANEYNFESNIPYYIPWIENGIIKDDNIDIEIIKQENRKHLLKGNDISLIYPNENQSLEFKDTKKFNIFGHNAKICENPNNSIYLSNIIKNDHLIYYVKAEQGHYIENGEREITHKFDSKNGLSVLKQAKNIWYIFTDTNWGIKNGWVFRDIENDTYFVPENNCILEFSINEKYEMKKLLTKDHKYFIVVINF